MRGLNKVGRRKILNKEETAEDRCFACKDGGSLIIYDYRDCLKAYHPECVNKDDSQMKTKEKWTCNLHHCFECDKSPKFYCLCCPSAICRPCLDEAEFAIVKGDKGLCDDYLELAMLIEDKKDDDSNWAELVSPDAVLSTFVTAIKNFRSKCFIREGGLRGLIRWVPPPAGVTKINMDAAKNWDEGIAAL